MIDVSPGLLKNGKDCSMWWDDRAKYRAHRAEYLAGQEEPRRLYREESNVRSQYLSFLGYLDSLSLDLSIVAY